MTKEWLLTEIERLALRPKAEVGIPMIVVPEDLTNVSTDGPDGPGDHPLANDFLTALALLESHKGALEPRDIAVVLEVLAEHSFLDRPFSSLLP